MNRIASISLTIGALSLIALLLKCSTSQPLIDAGYQSAGTPQKIVVKDNSGVVIMVLQKNRDQSLDTIYINSSDTIK